MRELCLEVARRHGVQFAELRKRAAPLLVLDGVLPVVGLVPDFPVGDLPSEAVCPALGVVADHVLADARPLRVVLRRIDAVRLYLAVVLDGHAQAEPRLHAVGDQGGQHLVRVQEVVVRRVVFVRVEIGEDVRDVHHVVTAVRNAAPDVVQARIRNARLLQVAEQLVVAQAQQRRLADCVHRLHRPHVLREIDLHLDGGGGERAECRRQDGGFPS